MGKWPHEVDEECSASEFVELLLQDQFEPFADVRNDLPAGMLMAMTANIHRDPKQGKTYSAADFMPYLEKAKPKSPIDIYNQLKALSNKKKKP